MRVWFTSDTHFYHKNIIKYCPTNRGHFKDENEMTEYLVSVWNERVGRDDLVFHLGDVALGNPQRAIEVLRRLNGMKVLVKGNHDTRLLTYRAFVNVWEGIYDAYTEIEIDDTPIVLSHQPMSKWNKMEEGAYHLHGHVHGNHMNRETGRRMDVGVDTRKDLAPWSWEEIHERLNERPVGVGTQDLFS
jgi:calcineurin-like phosphoesterase family protein